MIDSEIINVKLSDLSITKIMFQDELIWPECQAIDKLINKNIKFFYTVNTLVMYNGTFKDIKDLGNKTSKFKLDLQVINVSDNIIGIELKKNGRPLDYKEYSVDTIENTLRIDNEFLLKNIVDYDCLLCFNYTNTDKKYYSLSNWNPGVTDTATYTVHDTYPVTLDFSDKLYVVSTYNTDVHKMTWDYLTHDVANMYILHKYLI